VATAQADLLAEIGEVKNDSELFRGSADATRRHPGTGGQARFSAVMVHQPPHPYRSVNGWVAYHQEVARAAPDLSLVGYMAQLGLCRRDVRLPIVTLDQEESDEVEKLRAAWRVSASIDGHAEATGAHA
jgi:hypothetical protein